MEFYNEFHLSSPMEVDELKNLLVIKNLPLLCSSISSIIKNNDTNGIVYCIWGEFFINREELKYGIRFSLPDCPNALMWSITVESSGKSIVIHCTINKNHHEDDFILSIQDFVNDCTIGIKKEINMNQYHLHCLTECFME